MTPTFRARDLRFADKGSSEMREKHRLKSAQGQLPGIRLCLRSAGGGGSLRQSVEANAEPVGNTMMASRGSQSSRRPQFHGLLSVSENGGLAMRRELQHNKKQGG